MKKIFTIIMCLAGMLTAQATTTTIWEETGGQELNWDSGKTINLDIDSKGIVAGSTVTVYYSLIESASYHSAKFVSGYSWKYQDFHTQLDGLTGGSFSIDVTDEIIKKCSEDDNQLQVVGYGITVTKVEMTINTIDAISNVSTQLSAHSPQPYNLAGQRAVGQKGLVIENGKKVLK